MARGRIPGPLAAAFAMLLASAGPMVAADSHILKIARPMVVAGVNLRPGAYDLQWKFQGPQATVTFARQGRVVATVQGQAAVFDRSVPRNTLYISKLTEGIVAIYALGFASTNKGIVFPVIRVPARNPPGLPGTNPLGESWNNPTRPVPRSYK